MLCKKHQYFVLYRGDDTDFPGNQELIVELNTERDLTGCSAHFSFQGFTQDFAEIPSDKKLRLVIPNSATGKFALGAADAKLWLTNGTKIRTVENRIHIVVTNMVDEAYDNDDPQAITVTISGGGGGATVVLDDTVTEESPNGVKSSGIWSWVKSLLPRWLTSDYAEPATVSSVANKRDKDDLAVYDVVRTENTDWTWTSEDAELLSALQSSGVKPIWYVSGYWDVPNAGDFVFADTGALEYGHETTELYCRFLKEMGNLRSATATRPRYMDETLGPAKENQQIAAVATDDAAKPTNGNLMKYDSANDRFVKAVAGVDFRDPQDNTCHKTEFTEWSFSSTPQDSIIEEWANSGGVRIDYIESSDTWEAGEVFAPPAGYSSGLPKNIAVSADGLTAYISEAVVRGFTPISFTATRTAACTDGKKFVTDDVVDGKVSSAVSTNNPAFVSAVQNTPTSGMPEDMPTDWGTFSTVGAALAALAAGLKWCKNILGSLASGYSTFAAWIASKLDRASLVPEYSETSAYSVGVFVYHDGNIYQCKTAIADGGEAWNAEHWELRKLDDFFTESNSLLTGTIDGRLPIPISAKSAGFTTESYKRFVVTVSGDMTVTLHTPTSGDAEIFECRFDGTSLAADSSITFAGATATTMDANCGTVTAGKVALMSAFWNGTTWDVNWKVGG